MNRTALCLALVLAVTLVCPLPGSAGQFTDLTGAKAEAVDRLAALNIVQGITPTAFGPAQPVKRCQLAAFVVRALNLEQVALVSAGATPFNDVPSGHWATGHINVASSLGIVVGHGGKFRPEDPVTYAEVAAMLVRALGYSDQEMLLLGRWPVGHLSKALSLGLLAGVSEFSSDVNATRGAVALLLDNTVFKAPTRSGPTLADSVFRHSRVASLVIEPGTVQLRQGTSVRFTAKGADADGRPVPVTPQWTCEGPGVIDRDTGNLAAIGAGTIRVTATAGQLTAMAEAKVAGHAAKVAVDLPAPSLTANGETVMPVTFAIKDADGLRVPGEQRELTAVITGDAEFLVGTARYTTLTLTTADGAVSVAVVGKAGRYADSGAQINLQSTGLAPDWQTLQLTRPVLQRLALSVEPPVFEATAGSQAELVLRALDANGVNIPAPTAYGVALSCSDAGVLGVPTSLTLGFNEQEVRSLVSATSRPGAVTVSGFAAGVQVQSGSVSTAIAGNKYKLAFAVTPSPQAAGSVFTVKVAVQDFNGITKTTDATTSITLTAKGADGALLASSTATVVRGVSTHLLNLTVPTGAVTLEAQSPGLQPALAATALLPGAPAFVSMGAAEPPIIAANGLQQARVFARITDAYGNTVTGATNRVTFTRISGLPYATTLPAMVTVPAVDGIASIQVSSTSNVGTDTFQATAPGLACLGATSVQTAIIGIANRLTVLQAPLHVSAGSDLTVRVEVRDAAGTLVSMDQGRPVYLTVTGGTLGAANVTLASPALTVNGVAAFKLRSTQTGTVRVQAASPGLSPFELTLAGEFIPGAPVAVKLIPRLAAIETGPASSTGIDVDAVDSYGNVTGHAVTGGLSLVHTLGSLAPGGGGAGDPEYVLTAGTASGTCSLYDSDGLAQVTVGTASLNLPVQPCSISLYNAGPAHRVRIRTVAAVAVGPYPQHPGALVVIEITDSEGRIKTGDSSSMVKLAAAGDVLSLGWYTAAYATVANPGGTGLAVTNGVVAYRVTNNKAGTVTWTASATGLQPHSLTSQFMVGPAHGVVLSASPTAVKADGVSVVGLTAQVVDSLFNPITTYPGTMHFELSSGSDFLTLLSTTQSIVGGTAYNTAQARRRDADFTVQARAATLINGTLVWSDACLVRVDGWWPLATANWGTALDKVLVSFDEPVVNAANKLYYTYSGGGLTVTNVVDRGGNAYELQLSGNHAAGHTLTLSSAIADQVGNPACFSRSPWSQTATKP